MDKRERYQKGRERCRTCVYRAGTSGKDGTACGCDYISITGRPRSAICKPGLDCTVYRKGKRMEVEP